MGMNNAAGTGVCLCGRCGTENCTAFLLGVQSTRDGAVYTLAASS